MMRAVAAFAVVGGWLWVIAVIAMVATHIADSKGGSSVGPYPIDFLFLAVMVVVGSVGALIAVWGHRRRRRDQS